MDVYAISGSELVNSAYNTSVLPSMKKEEKGEGGERTDNPKPIVGNFTLREYGSDFGSLQNNNSEQIYFFRVPEETSAYNMLELGFIDDTTGNIVQQLDLALLDVGEMYCLQIINVNFENEAYHIISLFEYNGNTKTVLVSNPAYNKSRIGAIRLSDRRWEYLNIYGFSRNIDCTVEKIDERTYDNVSGFLNLPELQMERGSNYLDVFTILVNDSEAVTKSYKLSNSRYPIATLATDYQNFRGRTTIGWYTNTEQIFDDMTLISVLIGYSAGEKVSDDYSVDSNMLECSYASQNAVCNNILRCFTIPANMITLQCQTPSSVRHSIFKITHNRA